MPEQTHLKCHQNIVPDSALSQMTLRARLQVPERLSVEQESASGQHMKQSKRYASHLR